MYAARKVGPSGRVVAVDRADLTIGIPDNVTFVRADALAIDPAELLAETGVERFDAVISDMAPRTSGHRFVDQTRSFNLFARALELAETTLRKGGSFTGKIFQGEDFEKARDMVRERFSRARIIRPASVRTESYEIYLVGIDMR
jgi:23S rRNA (uridine2552-2'-O)-methyltransferase